MQAKTNKKVIVGISGGVDSAVSAYLLKEQGYDVHGLFMKNWEEDDTKEYCLAAVDLEDAKNVCGILDIPLQTINFATEYWDFVFQYFLEEYRNGRTPNPDIMCNKEIKFKAFLEHALKQGADYIATGHYVDSAIVADEVHMLKGEDDNKDQSYFLYTLGQEQLKRSLFPLGKIHKPEVREIAKRLGFSNAKKKDSTGICFIGERKFNDFLERFLPANPGDIMSADGKHLGRHNGLMFHTIGQRKGLGIGGLQQSTAEPWYVYAKDLENNRLLVCQGVDNPLLYTDRLSCSQLHWVAGAAPEEVFNATAKVRYRQTDQRCHVTLTETGAEVVFDEPQRAITTGQSIVFYEDNRCLGGGIIDSTWNEEVE